MNEGRILRFTHTTMEARAVVSRGNSTKRFSFIIKLSEGFGALLLFLIAIWALHFRGGFAWTSNPKLEFNWHPLLMTFSLIFLHGNGILLFRILCCHGKHQLKLIHASCHVLTFVILVMGLQAVFDSHNLAHPPIPNLYTLHSWVGLVTVILFCSQFVAGLVLLFLPGVNADLRALYMPMHRFFGITGFVLAIAAALMGFLEKAIFAIKDYKNLEAEGLLVNIIGMVMLIYGILVIYAITDEDSKHPPNFDYETMVIATPTKPAEFVF